MKFSIIIPSYNQDRFIGETIENLRVLKKAAADSGHEIEILLFDNNSNKAVIEIIHSNKDLFNVLEIKSDRGQFDAINKGIAKLSGKYWTWLNTDDLIKVDGFLRIAEILNKSATIDYIYGNIEIIDEHSKKNRTAHAKELNFHDLVNGDPGVYQPGSFFRKEFTDRIGLLKEYRCCFDYEYILRIMKNKGKLYRCDFTVAKFRLYNNSKSGSIVAIFIREQLQISKQNGRKTLSRLGVISKLRLLKRKFLK